MKAILFTICITISTVFQTVCQENKLSIPELMINSTIRLECYGDTVLNGVKGRFQSIGTGFFFQFQIDTFKVPVIVTNYHVISNTDTCILNFTERGKDGPIYGNILIDTVLDFKHKWIKHPNVDLAIIPLVPIVQHIKQRKSKTPFYVTYSNEILPSEKVINEVNAIEEVFMIGYPKGFWDKTNNLPVVRMGITATPIYLDYEGRKEFLIDIPIFAGSSGSPIVLFNQGQYSTRNGGINIGRGRIALLGINAQSINYSAEGKLLLPPGKPMIQTSTQIPLDIAVAIKSEKILDFEPFLKKMIESSK